MRDREKMFLGVMRFWISLKKWVIVNEFYLNTLSSLQSLKQLTWRLWAHFYVNCSLKGQSFPTESIHYCQQRSALHQKRNAYGHFILRFKGSDNEFMWTLNTKSKNWHVLIWSFHMHLFHSQEKWCQCCLNTLE